MLRVGSAVRILILCSLTIGTLAFAEHASKTVETLPSGFAISQRVSDLPLDLAAQVGEQIHEPGPGPFRLKGAAPAALGQEDQVLQKETTPLVSATPGASFSGISSPGYVPSDSNLAVGPSDIVEVVNVQFAVYGKNGALKAGPSDIKSLFSPLGGGCAATFGDPIVLYDRAADRWMISYIGSNAAGTSASECVAVSKTNDPTGTYYLYGYSFGGNLNDYPKLSTWATATNGAYLATYNMFESFAIFTGSNLCAFDRTKMLAGNASAAQICQQAPSSEFGYLPADMDGPTPPVDGTPGLFISWFNNSPGQLYLRKLKVNFSAGTATLSPPTVISVADSNLACSNGGQCVPQSGTTQTLDSLGDRLMYRFAVRHFSDHDRAVVNHAVGSGGQVGVRWYELYDPAGTPTLHQQGTFAPDATYRWMASLAEDQVGDIGLAYSVSSGSMHPAIRFTGRVPTDAAGTMEAESTIVQGDGSQTGSYGNRWGDYTAMQVDPSDDCTFWYVDQYQKVTGEFDWSTNISSFAFSGCSSTPSFTLGGSPASVSVSQGGKATTSITVNALNGFSGSVKLSLSGLPTSVTAAFSTNPTTTASTHTFTAGASAPAGTSTITVKGVSGSLSETTTVQLTVTGSGSGTTVSLNPTSLKWGTLRVGLTSCCKAVTLTNTGTATLNISSVTASGDFAVKTLPASCGTTVAAGAKCLVKVSFSPTQTGTRTGTLTINDNATGSPQTVPLSGAGR